MEIHDSCKCGAIFSIKDNSNTYCEAGHNAFLKAHEVCRVSETSEQPASTQQPQAGSVASPKPCASCVHNGEAGTHCNRCAWSYRNLFSPKE